MEDNTVNKFDKICLCESCLDSSILTESNNLIINTVDHVIVTDITLGLSNAISLSQAKYHERLAIKLNDPKTTPKTYWSILKTFVSGSKIPPIPPFLGNNDFLTDFLVKANLFNDFFREQCKPITNDSSLPNNQIIETVTRLFRL